MIEPLCIHYRQCEVTLLMECEFLMRHVRSVEIIAKVSSIPKLTYKRKLNMSDFQEFMFTLNMQCSVLSSKK